MNLPTRQPQSVPAVCRMLRTKTAYGPFEGDDPWELATSTTAVYWCMCTMQPSGPDDDLVHPQQCCAGRPCYQARPG